jgi:hypothetical protein
MKPRLSAKNKTLCQYVYMHFCCVYKLGVPNAHACGASPLGKNTPLEFGACTLCIFVTFHYFQLGVPNVRACGASLISEKAGPWTCVSRYLVDATIFIALLCLEYHFQ